MMTDFIPYADDAKFIWLTNLRYINSPYDDYTPLAVPGVAEVREYQAYGVLNDAQIGQPSDIVSVTFGGIAVIEKLQPKLRYE